MASLASVLMQIWVQSVFACLMGAFLVWMFFLQRLNIVERGALAHWSSRPIKDLSKKRNPSADDSNCKDVKIEDLDLDGLFDRLYWYFIHKGFFYVVAHELAELVKYCFMIGLAFFLMQCVDLDLIPWARKGKDGKNAQWTLWTRPSIYTAIIPIQECVTNSLSGWEAVGVFAATGYFLFLLARNVYHFLLCWELRRYYADVLMIDDDAIDLMTWQEVMLRIREAAAAGQICVGKQDISELDIYNIILRRKNYLISVMDLITFESSYHLPIVGSVVFASKTLFSYVDLILFGIPWLPYNDAPFRHGRFLRPKYKDRSRRKEATEHLQRRIMWFAMISVVMAPFMFFYRIWDTICQYFETMKRAPGDLHKRMWSAYARCNCRHINELHHEINYRLNSSSPAASTYMDSFVRRSTGIASFLAYALTAILGVLIALVLYDEVFVNIGGVVTLMSTCGTMLALIRGILPNPNYIFHPEKHMRSVVKNLHYVPVFFLERARAAFVKHEFALLYETRWWKMFYNLFSPVFTPIYLIFEVYPQAGSIVRFLSENTISVDGIGDVCTMSRFNLEENGNHLWQLPGYEVTTDDLIGGRRRRIGADGGGRVELSLLRFAAANPKWTPSRQQRKFLKSIERAMKELKQGTLHARQRVEAGDDKTLARKPAGNSSLSPQDSGVVPVLCEIAQKLEQISKKTVLVGNHSFLLTLTRLTSQLSIEETMRDRHEPCRKQASVCDLSINDDPSTGDSALASGSILDSPVFNPNSKNFNWQSDSTGSMSPDVNLRSTNSPTPFFIPDSTLNSPGTNVSSPMELLPCCGAAGDVSVSSHIFVQSPERRAALSPTPARRVFGDIRPHWSPPCQRRRGYFENMASISPSATPVFPPIQPPRSFASDWQISPSEETSYRSTGSPFDHRKNKTSEGILRNPGGQHSPIDTKSQDLDASDNSSKENAASCQKTESTTVSKMADLDCSMQQREDFSRNAVPEKPHGLTNQPFPPREAIFLPFGEHPCLSQRRQLYPAARSTAGVNEEESEPKPKIEVTKSSRAPTGPTAVRFAVENDQPSLEEADKSRKVRKRRQTGPVGKLTLDMHMISSDSSTEDRRGSSNYSPAIPRSGKSEIPAIRPGGKTQQIPRKEVGQTIAKPTRRAFDDASELSAKQRAPERAPVLTKVKFAEESRQPLREKADQAQKTKRRRQTGPVGKLTLDMRIISSESSSEERVDYVPAISPSGKGQAKFSATKPRAIIDPTNPAGKLDQEPTKARQQPRRVYDDENPSEKPKKDVGFGKPKPDRNPGTQSSSSVEENRRLEGTRVPTGKPIQAASKETEVVHRRSTQGKQTGPPEIVLSDQNWIISDSTDEFSPTGMSPGVQGDAMYTSLRVQHEESTDEEICDIRAPEIDANQENPTTPAVRFTVEGSQSALVNSDHSERLRSRKQTGPSVVLALDFDTSSTDEESDATKRHLFSTLSGGRGKLAFVPFAVPAQERPKKQKAPRVPSVASEGDSPMASTPKSRIAFDDKPPTSSGVPKTKKGIRFKTNEDKIPPSIPKPNPIKKATDQPKGKARFAEEEPVGTVRFAPEVTSEQSKQQTAQEAHQKRRRQTGPVGSLSLNVAELSSEPSEESPPPVITILGKGKSSKADKGQPIVKFTPEILAKEQKGQSHQESLQKKRRQTGPVGSLTTNLDELSSDPSDGSPPPEIFNRGKTPNVQKVAKPPVRFVAAESEPTRETETTAAIHKRRQTGPAGSLQFNEDGLSSEESNSSPTESENVRFAVPDDQPERESGKDYKRRQTGPVASLTFDLEGVSEESEAGNSPPSVVRFAADQSHPARETETQEALHKRRQTGPVGSLSFNLEEDPSESDDQDQFSPQSGVHFAIEDQEHPTRETETSAALHKRRQTGPGLLEFNLEDNTASESDGSSEESSHSGVRFVVQDEEHPSRETETAAAIHKRRPTGPVGSLALNSEDLTAEESETSAPTTTLQPAVRFATPDEDHPSRTTEGAEAAHKRRPTGPVGSLSFNMEDVTSESETSQPSSQLGQSHVKLSAEAQPQTPPKKEESKPASDKPRHSGIDLNESTPKRRVTMRRPTLSVASMKIELSNFNSSESEKSQSPPPIQKLPSPPLDRAPSSFIAAHSKRRQTGPVGSIQVPEVTSDKEVSPTLQEIRGSFARHSPPTEEDPPLESFRPSTLPPPPARTKQGSFSASGRPILNLSDVSTPTDLDSTEEELFSEIKVIAPVAEDLQQRASFTPLIWQGKAEKPERKTEPYLKPITDQTKSPATSNDEGPFSERLKALSSTSSEEEHMQMTVQQSKQPSFKPFAPLSKTHQPPPERQTFAVNKERLLVSSGTNEPPVGPDEKTGRTVRFASELQKPERPTEPRRSQAIRQRRPTGAVMGLFKVLLPGSSSSQSESESASNSDEADSSSSKTEDKRQSNQGLFAVSSQAEMFKAHMKRRPTIAFRGRMSDSETETEEKSGRKPKSSSEHPDMKVSAEAQVPSATQGKAAGKRRKTFFFPKAGPAAKEEERDDFEDDTEDWKFGFDRDTVGEAVLFLYEIYVRNAQGVDDPIDVEAVEVDSFGARSRRAESSSRRVVPTNELIEMDA